MPYDSFKRKIDYLRVSVTDRCNLRCVYCLPEDYRDFSPSGQVLSDEEMVTLVSCFAELGFSKLRVTGGEPLIRHGIADLIQAFSGIPGIDNIALSTNGMLLGSQAGRLAESGLNRVNVSLDSLRPERFARMTRHGKLKTVLDGIGAALEAGISPVKINVVVVRGENEDEIPEFARLTEALPVHVRFIELMPMGETGYYSEERRVPLSEILEKALPLDPLPKNAWPAGHGPASYLRRPNGKGTIGFISAVSCGFCASCNRVRLSARGVLVPCLDGWMGVDLGHALRQGATKEALQRMILGAVEEKPERHFMMERGNGALQMQNPRTMCSIGG